MVNIFRFASHIVSVATYPCPCNVKGAIGKTEVSKQGCVLTKLFLCKNVVDLIWPVDHRLPASGIEQFIRSQFIQKEVEEN